MSIDVKHPEVEVEVEVAALCSMRKGDTRARLKADARKPLY